MSSRKAPIAYFDLVRGASAQFVLIGHSLNLFLPGIMMMATADGRWVGRSGVLYVQNVGVLAFFVLSGYLVTRSLRSKPASYGLKHYVLDRSARIFVPFIPAVLLVWAGDMLVFGSSGSSRFTELPLGFGTVVGNLLMLFDNVLIESASTLVGHPVVIERVGSADPFWSVSIEWWIYLVFGIAWLGVSRRLRWSVPVLVVLAFALGTTAGHLLEHPAVVLAWAVGMAYAWGSEWVERLPRWVNGAAASGAMGLALVGCIASHGDVYGPAVSMGLSIAIMSGYHAIGHRDLVGRSDRWPSRVSTFVSQYSYSLYLVHFSVLIYLESLLPQFFSGLARMVLGFVLANAVAICFWWLFERHYARIGKFIGARWKTDASQFARPRAT